MKIFTIGFTQKTAEEFFEGLKGNDISTVIDIRLNNKSQLAGFAKGRDLKYFLKRLCDIEYVYDPDFAPSKELLDDWKQNRIEWDAYENRYNEILLERNAGELFANRYVNVDTNIPLNVCLLCSESTPEHCHRRLLAEYLTKKCEGLEKTEVIHL